MKQLIRSALGLCLAFFAPAPALQAAPVNNAFNSAIQITGSSNTVTGSNVEASKQNFEPSHAGNQGGKSIWWYWTAPASGSVQIDTIGSTGVDTLLGVYTGTSVSFLSTVASSDNISGTVTQSLVNFTATAGTIYRIAVDGKRLANNGGGSGSADEGDIVLNVFQAPPAPPAPTVTLVSTGSVWRYLDNGSDQGTAWRASGFIDSSWASGPAQLGFGSLFTRATVVSYGPDANNKYITTYFRHAFYVTNAATYTNLTLYLKRDDGAVVYLNGTEIVRDNMPSGTIDYLTFSSTGASDDGATFYSFSISPSSLVSGSNYLAVEVHQTTLTSSDLNLDLKLDAIADVNQSAGTTVALTAPANNAVINLAAVSSIALAATATNATASVTNVEFYQGTTLLGQDATLPFDFNWSGMATGAYVLRAVATDTNGAGVRTTSAPVNITVLSNYFPTVTLTNPANNASFVSPASVTMQAVTTDGVGTVTNVDFYGNNVWLDLDASSPYSYVWTGASLGSNQLYAVAKDTAGFSVTSAPINITVSIVYVPVTNILGRTGFEEAAMTTNSQSGFATELSFTNTYTIAGSPTPTFAAVDTSGRVTNNVLGGDALIDPANTGKTGSKYFVQANKITANAGARQCDLTFGAVTISGYTNRTVSMKVFISSTTWETGTTAAGTLDFVRASLHFSDATTNALLDTAAGPSSGDMDSQTSGLVEGSWVTLTYSIPDSVSAATVYLRLTFSGNSSTGAEGFAFDEIIFAGVSPAAVSIALSAPVNSETVNLATVSSINLAAGVITNSMTVTNVEFFQSSTLLGQDTTAPYAFSWSNMVVGGYTLRAVASDSSGSRYTSAPVSITVISNYFPTVTLTNPANNTAFFTPATVDLGAQAADSDGSVTNVEFYQGSTLLGQDNNNPYAFVWNSPAVGSYTLRAVAVDNTGARSTSAPVAITVSNNIAPTVSVTNPANGSLFFSPATVTLGAAAADSDGTVASVSFYTNGVLFGTDFASPYSLVWNNVQTENYEIFAVATDNNGLSSTSSPVYIAVGIPNLVSLISTGSVWRYLDTGTNAGTSWRESNFDDSAWASGPAELGYGDADEATEVNNVDGDTLITTTYFRHAFIVTNAEDFISLVVRLKRDDGVAVYLNGTEIIRDNLVNGAGHLTLATANAGDDGTSFLQFVVAPAALISGTNILAAEIHQASLASSDISFELELTGTNVSLVPKPPTIALTAPASNAVVSLAVTSSITLTATALGNGATVTNVEFYQASTKLGEDTTAPYANVWSNLAVGSYTLRAVAMDDLGARATSAPVNISIVANASPTVSITSPANGAGFASGSAVTINVSASDADGSVTNVDFYDGATLLGSDTAAPYSFNIVSLGGGSHPLKAVAWDNLGATNTSATVTISAASTTLTRGPYLLNGTTNGALVRWCSSAASDGYVRYGTNINDLNLGAAETTSKTNHIVQLTNLQPNTTYYYSVGTSNSTIASKTNFFFTTPPHIGTPQLTRMWVLGDAGSGSTAQRNVRDAYNTYAATNGKADLILMLGDNAYNSGTDAEFQTTLFNVYTNNMCNTFTYACVGNHDTGQTFTTNQSIPMFNWFTIPKNGEVGGIPSGNNRYFSYDHANIHFVVLDSMASTYVDFTVASNPMLNWLTNDLESTSQPWIIVFFHHPPYTHGSHTSETEADLVAIRENWTPLLESYGVDLVLNGHSHVYERSYLVQGHTSYATNFNAATMIVSGGSGDPLTNGAYQKPTTVGTVYAVNGNSGGQSAITFTTNIHDRYGKMPMMYQSLGTAGSMVIEVSDNRLDAIYLNSSTVIQDRFAIIKPGRPSAPTTLIATALATNQIQLGWTDTATNEFGFKIERGTDGVNFTQIAALGSNVTSHLDSGLLANTTYYYRVTATNNIGNSDASNIASATTFAPPVIVTQPASRTNNVGTTATFTVAATGTSLTYQWRFNGNNLSGQTDSTLTLNNVQNSNAGPYTVRITNSYGAVTSIIANLTINNRAPTAIDTAASTVMNQPLVIDTAKLLTTASDLDGDVLSVSAVTTPSANGGVVVLGVSTITYTPSNNYVGADLFSYTVSDGYGGTTNVSVLVQVTTGSASGNNMLPLAVVSNGILVRFAGIPGRTYSLQRTLLAPISWTNLSPVLTAPSGIGQYTDTNPPSGGGFYRTLYP